MAEAQEAVNRSAVRKPSGGMAGRGSPGRRQYGNRPPFKNGSNGLSKTNKLEVKKSIGRLFIVVLPSYKPPLLIS